jgi:hypothetical protein
MACHLPLDQRAVFAVEGEDRVGFLQGLVSNDITRVGPDRAVFSAFLTAQGKYLHDFFVAAEGERLLIDCEAERAGDLLRRLKLYKLRSKVTLVPPGGAGTALAVHVVWGEDAAAALGLDAGEAGRARPLGGGVAFVDPRLARLGVRALLPAATAADTLAAAGIEPGRAADYEALRLAAGIPDGSRDALVEKSTLLEVNYDDLNAISWDKGCYMGQELTARTRYRGLVKRRLVPVRVDGPLPEPGTPVTADGREVGEMRSGAGDRALALMRLDALGDAAAADAGFAAGDARIAPERPDWARY